MPRIAVSLLIPIALLTRAGPAQPGEGEPFAVAGEIAFSGTAPLYLELVERDEFDGGLPSPFGLVLRPTAEEAARGRAAFSFQGVPPGTYGIRSFQDTNGTGKLETGLFGPKEPWGMYRPCRPALRGPRFDEISFIVDRDLAGLVFEVK